MTRNCPPREIASMISTGLKPPRRRRKSARLDISYFNQFSICECSREPQNDSRDIYGLGGKNDAKCGKLLYIYSTRTSAQCSVCTWRLEDEWERELQEGGGICVHIADSLAAQKKSAVEKAINL